MRNTVSHTAMREGTWRITAIQVGHYAAWGTTALQYPDTSPAYYYLEHICDRDPWTETNNTWKGHNYHPEERGNACPHCGSRPSEGLQAMFWFLASQYAY